MSPFEDWFVKSHRRRYCEWEREIWRLRPARDAAVFETCEEIRNEIRRWVDQQPKNWDKSRTIRWSVLSIGNLLSSCAKRIQNIQNIVNIRLGVNQIVTYFDTMSRYPCRWLTKLSITSPSDWSCFESRFNGSVLADNFDLFDLIFTMVLYERSLYTNHLPCKNKSMYETFYISSHLWYNQVHGERREKEVQRLK